MWNVDGWMLHYDNSSCGLTGPLELTKHHEWQVAIGRPLCEWSRHHMPPASLFVWKLPPPPPNCSCPASIHPSITHHTVITSAKTKSNQLSEQWRSSNLPYSFGLKACQNYFNPLLCQGNYGAISNNMKLVHWLLVDGSARRGLCRAVACPGPSLLYQM